MSKRIEKGYSQEFMAFILGISQQAYSKIERGATKLKLKDYLIIIKELDIKD